MASSRRMRSHASSAATARAPIAAVRPASVVEALFRTSPFSFAGESPLVASKLPSASTVRSVSAIHERASPSASSLAIATIPSATARAAAPRFAPRASRSSPAMSSSSGTSASRYTSSLEWSTATALSAKYNAASGTGE